MSKKIEKASLSPMPWRDFVLGFQVATTALENPNLEDIPPVNPDDPTSKKLHDTQVAIQKDPFLRVLLAAQHHFGDGYEHLGKFVYRFWALIHLLKRGHIKEWITHDEESDFQSFHPAVLLAAAEVKLTNNARFPPKRFVERVHTIMEEES